MKKLKYVKLFDNYQINEGLFDNIFGGSKTQTQPVETGTDDVQSKVTSVFPESIYGNYVSKLPKEHMYKLLQVIDNNSGVMNDGAFLDVLSGDESKREELSEEQLSIFWLKCLFSLIEKGYFFDRKGQKFDFSFFNGLTETSLKQVMNKIPSKSNLISELVMMSREKGMMISDLISKKM